MKVKVTFNEINHGDFSEFKWNLEYTKQSGEVKKFYLGQDIKFCRRVLGLETKDIVRKIGNPDLREEETQIKLGAFIVDHLNLSEPLLDDMDIWELSAE
jgi:hypothetical protein